MLYCIAEDIFKEVLDKYGIPYINVCVESDKIFRATIKIGNSEEDIGLFISKGMYRNKSQARNSIDVKMLRCQMQSYVTKILEKHGYDTGGISEPIVWGSVTRLCEKWKHPNLKIIFDNSYDEIIYSRWKLDKSTTEDVGLWIDGIITKHRDELLDKLVNEIDTTVAVR